MPLYEYLCQDCSNKFEVKASLPEKEKGLKVACPKCNSCRTIQVLGSFFTFSKNGQFNPGGCCGTGSGRGCCG